MRVFVDTSSLYGACQRDLLLRLSDAGLYGVYWSSRTLRELERVLVASGRTSRRQAARLTAALRRAFPEATIEITGRALPWSDLPPEDRHVFEGAIKVGAEIIVSEDRGVLTSSPENALDIQLMDTDDFLCRQWERDPELVCSVAEEQRQALTNPAMSRARWLQGLAETCPRLVSLLRQP